MTRERPPWAARIRRARLAQQPQWSQARAVAALQQHAAASSITLPGRDSLVRMLKSWEAGEHQPDARYRWLLSQVYGVSEHDLFRKPSSASAMATGPEAHVGGEGPVEANTMNLDEDGKGDDTNRRQVLTASGLGLFEMFTGARPEMPWTPPPAAVDPAFVEHLTTVRVLLVDADNRLGAATVLPTVVTQLGMIAQLRRQARGPVHDQLLSTESRWAELAGWLSDDLGDQAAGTRWLGRSMSMAQEANDVDFTAYLLARTAQRTVGGADEDRVLGLAHAATRTGTTHRGVRAFAAVQHALGHAAAGETCLFESAVDQAQVLAQDQAAQPGDLGSFCTPAYVIAQEADGWLRLHQPHRSANRFEQALAIWPDHHQRDRGLCLARAAAAQLGSNQIDKAIATALDAVTLADLTRSAKVRHQVVALTQQLTQLGHRAAADRMQAALATPSQDPR